MLPCLRPRGRRRPQRVTGMMATTVTAVRTKQIATKTEEVILQNFWNIGSDFGTFFEAK